MKPSPPRATIRSASLSSTHEYVCLRKCSAFRASSVIDTASAIFIFASPARYAHVPGTGRRCPLGDAEVMSLGLDRHRPVKRCVQQVVVIITPHQFPQIDLVILAQAEIELYGGGQPHAIAALAEVDRKSTRLTYSH